MDLPFWLGDLCVDHGARGWVVQLAPRVVKDASVDPLLHNDHRKLGPDEER